MTPLIFGPLLNPKISISVCKKPEKNIENMFSNIIKKRFLGFLLWQFVQSSLIYIVFKTFLFLSFKPSPSTLLTFPSYILFLFVFSAAIFAVSSPQSSRAASPLELALGLVRLVFVSGPSPNYELRCKAHVSVKFALFALASMVSGFVAFVAMCWVKSNGSDGVMERVFELGLRGCGLGLFYGVHYLLKRRWILEFPIIQRPLFFSYKMGLPSAVKRALRLSFVAYILSSVTVVFMPRKNVHYTVGSLIIRQIGLYVGSFAVFLCWELSHHLHQVLLTKRFVFAPPKGSAAAETNPSESLLTALEESTPRSLLQYLAYLDLNTVCESNVDAWRRAAFFEETGETYKRVMAITLRPLERLASELGEGLGHCHPDNTKGISHQLRSPTDVLSNSNFDETFDNFQLCAWCARAVASLTACSRTEDRFGVAQLSGSNAHVMSTLISCLLAVETFMGKKTNLQNPNQVMGPAGIKWATMNTGRREVTTDVFNKKRDQPLYGKSYAIADILRTSIYQIVSSFHDEMLSGAKSGLLEKDWVTSKPHYCTRELILQKMRIFLDFRAN